ncbi:glucose-6-phosphate isomerase [Nocardioides limicola]|uniref:glucose-6-phosphate isomerase n=1 Tax=Nocardioides limicola TaxID=2803368 RepID=UPI0027DC11A8|nr:glucose-6-phosphate isomerase [Nocardioides sp. DJM-14]
MTPNQVTAPGVEMLFGYPDEGAYVGAVQRLVDDSVASRTAAGDPTLWGPAAEAEAALRLGWTSLPDTSRPLVAQIAALRAELLAEGLDRVVLCGMGGSSLAPEVICAAAQVELTVLDSSHPDAVRAALSDRLDRTVVVVSSKSGGTVETDSQWRAFAEAFRSAGWDPARRIVMVTDPGSPLHASATEAGHRVFEADPMVGGRYSALTAFGLVPSGLAGVDLDRLLDEAASVRARLESDSAENPGVRLGALLGAAALHGVDKLVLADAGSPYPGLGDWVEQLVAESTGKEGRGIAPVVVESVSAPGFTPSSTDGVLVTYGPDFVFDTVRPASGWGATVDAGLGAQFLIWEYATVHASRLLGVNPFDQPDVESAKAAARELLDHAGTPADPAFVDGSVAIHGQPAWLGSADTVEDAVLALLAQLDSQRGYLAVQAYLPSTRDSRVAGTRAALARRTGRPVTFGWGPRFLHSTGQYHKGGPHTGVFLQLTGLVEEELSIPGREFSFGDFIAAQAAGDAAVLTDQGRPVLRLQIADQSGLERVLEVLS